MKEYTYYLFDFDGTLADTTRLIVHCFHEMLKNYGITVTDQDIIQKIGMPLIPQLELFMGTIPPEQHQQKMREYQAIQFKIFKDWITLFPGVENTLTELKKMGKKLAVVTSRSQNGLDLFIDHLNIRGLFDLFITPEITKKHKPSPEPALKALELLGGDPADALFIGDASFDIGCGNSAGMDTAFVMWSYNDPEKLPVQATCYLKDIADLITK